MQCFFCMNIIRHILHLFIYTWCCIPKGKKPIFRFQKKTFIASLKMVRLGIGIPYYKYISKVENKVSRLYSSITYWWEEVTKLWYFLKANKPFCFSLFFYFLLMRGGYKLFPFKKYHHFRKDIVHFCC